VGLIGIIFPAGVRHISICFRQSIERQTVCAAKPYPSVLSSSLVAGHFIASSFCYLAPVPHGNQDT
jgi:hypothetical protein